jgi:hypothetical protein
MHHGHRILFGRQDTANYFGHDSLPSAASRVATSEMRVMIFSKSSLFWKKLDHNLRSSEREAGVTDERINRCEV